MDDINRQQLDKLGGKTHSFSHDRQGARTVRAGAEARLPLPGGASALKTGAAVMFTRNDQGGRYVNGTLGVVEDFDADDDYPVVATHSGKHIILAQSPPPGRSTREARSGQVSRKFH